MVAGIPSRPGGSVEIGATDDVKGAAYLDHLLASLGVVLLRWPNAGPPTPPNFGHPATIPTLHFEVYP